MSRVPNAGMMVLAETGAMRRAIERVEALALELEQAIADLNRMSITVELRPSPPLSPEVIDGLRESVVSAARRAGTRKVQ